MVNMMYFEQVVAAMLVPPLIFFSVRFSDLGSSTHEHLSASQKLLTFYKAPVTKFAANVVGFGYCLCVLLMKESFFSVTYDFSVSYTVYIDDKSIKI